MTGQVRNLEPVTTYLPQRLRRWLEARAAANGRNISAEIRYVLAQVHDADPDWPIGE